MKDVADAAEFELYTLFDFGIVRKNQLLSKNVYLVVYEIVNVAEVEPVSVESDETVREFKPLVGSITSG